MRSLLSIRLTSANVTRTIETALNARPDGVVVELPSSDLASQDQCLEALASAWPQPDTSSTRPRLYIRVSARTTDVTNDDLTQILSVRPHGLLLTHCETSKDVTAMDVRLSAAEAIAGLPTGTTDIIAEVTETANAVFGLKSYKDASPRLVALVWDADLLAKAIGAKSARDGNNELISPCQTARNLCLFGAAAAGIFAIDTSCPGLTNPTAVKREAERARQDGFHGKIATDVQQVAIFNEAFDSGDP